MNKRNDQRQQDTDDPLEHLLSEFFAQEVPQPLRELDARPTRVARSAEVNPSQDRAGALVAAAAAVVLITFALGRQSDRQPEIAASTPETESGVAAVEPVVSIGGPGNASDLPTAAAHESWLVEHFETPEGPVEYRENIRWTEVSVVEPETGAEKDLLLPELNIEVFPIEEPNSSEDAQP